MKTKLFFVLLFIVHCSLAQWSTSPDPDSSLYVCPGFTPTICTTQDGSSFIFGMASYNLWLQKLDPYGYKQWVQPTRVYQNAGSNFVYTLPTVLDNNGSIIVWWKDDRNAELDQWFTPTQNALYIQRINKFGQKMWSDTGLQVASLNGGIKRAYGVDDGKGGIILLVYEQDFYRTNKADKEWSKLIRYSSSGQMIWEHDIDSSTVNATIPYRQIYRVKNQILYFTLNGPQLVDTSGTKLLPPSYKNFGGIFIQNDTITIDLHSYLLKDSSDKLYRKLEIIKLSNEWDSISSTIYTTSNNVYLGDGGAGINPVLQLDRKGRIYFSYGYYTQSPLKYYIYLQRISQDGPEWYGDGLKFFSKNHPINFSLGNNDFGLIYNDYTFQKYSLNGDSLLQQRVQIFSVPSFEIDNDIVASDNNSGAIIAFWRGGIFAQHTGRTGKLGQITSVKTSATIPQDFVLYQNYPNPFNANTIIEYQIPRKEKITLKMYDVIGREIVTILDEVVGAGTYRANFDASTLSSGIYYYRLQTKDYVQVRKMILIK